LILKEETDLEIQEAEQRVVLTFNRKDFFRLHRQVVQHFGIIACTADIDFVGLAHRIDEAIEATSGSLENQLVRVNRPHPSQKKG